MAATEDFPRLISHYGGDSLWLEIAPDGWQLRGGGVALGELTLDPTNSPDWTARTRDGAWQMSWHGRLRKWIEVADEAGRPVLRFEGRRVGRRGTIVLVDGRELSLRPPPTGHHWRLASGDERLARVELLSRKSSLGVAVDLEPAAAYVDALSCVVLTACSVAILDHFIWTPAGATGDGGGGG